MVPAPTTFPPASAPLEAEAVAAQRERDLAAIKQALAARPAGTLLAATQPIPSLDLHRGDRIWLNPEGDVWVERTREV